MADDRLPCQRSESIAPTSSDRVVFRPRAISFNPSQNASSRVTLVLWPATMIERLTTSDFMKTPPQSSPDLDQNIGSLGRDARPNASAQPWTRTSQWMPMLQRAADTRPRPNSARLLPAGPWPRPTVGPLDFRLAVMTLQTESSRRSTTTGEKCHPRPRHCPAV